MDTQICNARADVRAAVNLDWALEAHGCCAAIDSMLPRQASILDSQAKMDVARICGSIRVAALVRSFVV